MTTLPSLAQKSVITQQGARAMGVEADLYFYPLVTVDLEHAKDLGQGPMNT